MATIQIPVHMEGQVMRDHRRPVEAMRDHRRPPPHPVPRGNAVAEVVLPGGRIALYKNGRVQATCTFPGHGASCKLSRTVKASPNNMTKGQPMAMMAAWLDTAGHFDDAESHKDLVAMHAVCDYDLRKLWRARLVEYDGGLALISYENPPSSEEPVDVFGMG